MLNPDLATFAVVYLIPIIPALFVFFILKPEQIIADASGTILGLSVKAGGGVAAYIIFMLLAGFLASLFIQPIDRTVKLYLELSGSKAAIRSVEDSASALTLILTPVDGKLRSERIDHFASLNPGKTLVATQPVDARFLGRPFTAALSTNLPNLKYSFFGVQEKSGGQPNPQFVLSAETTIRLNVQVVSDDPLTADDQIFQNDEWTESLLATAIQFDKLPDKKNERLQGALQREPNIKASETINSLLVFMNEGSKELGEIALTGRYSGNNPDARPAMIEAVARRITAADHLALSLRLSKAKNLFVQDASVINEVLADVINSYKTAGEELGFVQVSNVEPSAQKQTGELQLRDTEYRVGPLKRSVGPGEGVALIIRFFRDFYWLPIVPDVADSLTQRLTFPTRLWIISIKLPGDDIRFNPTSLSVEFTMRDGSHQSDLPGLQKKISEKYLSIQASLVNKDATGTFSWRWGGRN